MVASHRILSHLNFNPSIKDSDVSLTPCKPWLASLQLFVGHMKLLGLLGCFLARHAVIRSSKMARNQYGKISWLKQNPVVKTENSVF